MSKRTNSATTKDEAGDRQRRLVAMHLQHIEDNPLSAEQVAMFEMFEREAWSNDRRLAYIKKRANVASMVSASAE